MKKTLLSSVAVVALLVTGCGQHRPQDIRLDQYNKLEAYSKEFQNVVNTGQELTPSQWADIQSFSTYEQAFDQDTNTPFPPTEREKEAILLFDELNLDYEVYTQSSTDANKQTFQSDLKYFNGVLNGEYTTTQIKQHIDQASNSTN